ncbi:ISKra4 family transposase [Streptomyces gibsoniae]|uniref:ISKra4 family transposase n=1 Tax=Streptomyces gibsoniae TaxID=3075529 RepID=A0ABU2UAL3_9ACTN|nr:ISKra4 family transposase [Streptomyces sp. DSM 41699]MDT0470007.1 ISKra4 family transposase [Streptomyces sp. DSM 41699]
MDPADTFAASRTRMEEMLARLSDPLMMACTQEVLEDYVTVAGRELMRQIMQDQLDARATAEERRREVTGADGVMRTRAERGHVRLLATTVGRVEVSRIAYRSPASKVGNLHVADAELALPAQLYSRPLQRAVVHEAASGSLRQAAGAVQRATGQMIGTRQLMEICVRAAADINAFYVAPPDAAALRAAAGELLVLSCDATGVNMIPAGLREATRAAAEAQAQAGPQPPSAQLADRERGGRRRMATVTAVYDAAPVVRTAADILPRTAAERETRRREAPRARQREVHASLQLTTAEMIAAMFDQAERRDPEQRRRWIVLVDGNNHQLERIRDEAGRRGIHVDVVIDFVHVLEYLWKAAEDLHPTLPARQTHVADMARTILEGHASRVVADLNAHARARGLQEDSRSAQLPRLQRAIAYLKAKQPCLGYDLALALGWPIATGVIEGCCRYLIKDRLDVTGARWSLTGAEAVLLLRAMIDNGDFDAYWEYHGRLEYERQHTARYQQDFVVAA